MIVKILFLFAIILIALLLIVFSESVYISIVLKNNNLSHSGIVNIKYYFFQIAYDINSGQIILLINSKHLTKKITTITKEHPTDKIPSQEETSSKDSDDSDSSDENDRNLEKIKQLLKLICNSRNDIIELLATTLEIFSFKNSYILMDLGLGDNNLTIKTCNKLWALSAPFYTIGLQTILTPVLNKTILKTQLNVLIEIKLLKILKLTKQVLFNKNLRKIILFYIKSSD